CWQEVKVVRFFRLYNCLRRLTDLLRNVNEIENDPVLKSKDNIKISQTNVRVDHESPLPPQRERRAEARGCRRFPDPALSGRHNNNLTEPLLIPISVSHAHLFSLVEC